MEALYGLSPVLISLSLKKRTFYKLIVKKGLQGKRIYDILVEAEKRKVPVQYHDETELQKLCGNSHHQGIVLLADVLPKYDLDHILKTQPHNDKILVLDQVSDPQNVGALIRTAVFFHFNGVMITKDNSAPLSPSVCKASSGALEMLPVIAVPNLSRALKKLRGENFWIVGSSVDGTPFYDVQIPSRVALILGNEAHGIRRLTSRQCDFLLNIPGNAIINSLNVSAAGAIFMCHLTKK